MSEEESKRVRFCYLCDKHRAYLETSSQIPICKGCARLHLVEVTKTEPEKKPAKVVFSSTEEELDYDTMWEDYTGWEIWYGGV